MDRPAVQNTKLNSLLDELYRPGAKAGSGSTAAAVREELATGKPVGGRFHSQKARDYVIALRRWLADNPHASAGDRAAAESIIEDLENAVSGK
jgi:filamentous hemagglutinin